MSERVRVASGVSRLDFLLEGLFIGDNVVWHDDAGSLASVFCLNFIQASQAQGKPIIYVSFDRSPRNLIEKLGPLADYEQLTILDCFTHGKGAGSGVFLRFYQENESPKPYHVATVSDPRDVNEVMKTFYGLQEGMEEDVRIVFESVTGMQDLWGGEDHILKFYTHSCPRLYELNTVAYWIMEKRAHSMRLKAQINQIAQVAIDLSVKRGKTFLTILKAEKRNPDNLNKPYQYRAKDLSVAFDAEKRTPGRFDLGVRLKELRKKRGFSQTELAKLVGVTPSTISQVESGLIYPSVPALMKMAEVLSVEVSSFFQESEEARNRVIFSAAEAVAVKISDLPEDSVHVKMLTPPDLEPKAEPYLIEIPPLRNLPSHFFIHKGDEIGYLLSGELTVKLDQAVLKVHAGDLIYLTSQMPSQWSNPGPSTARMLWLKIR